MSEEPAPRPRRLLGSVVAFVGFLLSPLSWWNDAFVNIPIAWGVASLVALIRRGWFEPALYLAYLGTNVLGLVLMHLGVRMGLTKPRPFTRRDLLLQLLVALGYTALIFVLVRLGVIKEISNIF
jgi:hypothetical protein